MVLPPHSTLGPIASGAGEAPSTQTECKLAAIWKEVLGIGEMGEIGALDSFFGLGGNSLLAVQVTYGVREELDIDVPLATLFMAPTVRGLAARIDEMLTKRQELLGSIPQTEEKAEQARAILADPSASAAAKRGAKTFLEALRRG
jgi:acyl carrier protein